MRAGPLLLLSLALCGCAGGSFGGLAKKEELSYSQVQHVHPGLTASQIRDAYGEPIGLARGPRGGVQRMEYAALDAKGEKYRLILEFDDGERLVRKTFTGAVLVP